jgi:polygalacturonase
MLLFIFGCKSPKIIQEQTTRNKAINQITQHIKKPNIGLGVASIVDFGAIGNSTFDSRNAIQSAIKKLSSIGGGKVIFPKGNYFCKGPIHLESKINLHFEEGSTLVFSQDSKDYLPLQLVRWEGVEIHNYSPYIFAEGKTDIAITGKGILNGNAMGGVANWKQKQDSAQNLVRNMGMKLVPVSERIFGENQFLRMSFIQFMNCSNILIENITIQNVPFWVIHPTYSKNITIKNVKVNSTRINNDGIDLDSCEDVLVENCTFNAGDDAIAIKSGRDQDAWRVDKPSKNIVIRNCIAENVLHGMAFGSEMSGGIENVYVDNFFMKKVKKYAIQFKSNKDRGSYIKNVSIDGIFIDSTKTAIFFTNDYHSFQGGNSPSAFYNIQISNLICNYVSGSAIDIQGLLEKPIHHLNLKNIAINHEKEPSILVNIKESLFNNVLIEGEELLHKNK